MVSINAVDYFVLTGNCYPNKEAIKAAGGRWDNGAKMWTLPIRTHPLNNTKQRKKLVEQLNKLEEQGVRFTAWLLNGQRVGA